MLSELSFALMVDGLHDEEMARSLSSRISGLAVLGTGWVNGSMYWKMDESSREVNCCVVLSLSCLSSATQYAI